MSGQQDSKYLADSCQLGGGDRGGSTQSTVFLSYHVSKHQSLPDLAVLRRFR